jgi:hypothetical protein
VVLRTEIRRHRAKMRKNGRSPKIFRGRDLENEKPLELVEEFDKFKRL